jgi:hypothetical protein
LRAALLTVWLVFAILSSAVVAAPLIVPETWVARLVPMCESRRQTGKPCILCGMTTAFYAIGRADFSGALSAHSSSIGLYFMLVGLALSPSARLSLRRRRL